MIREQATKESGIVKARKQMLENERSICLDWKKEFETKFKKTCDLSSLKFGPLAADICCMIFIIILLHIQAFKIHFVILLSLEGATLSFNVFTILETSILFIRSINSESQGLKDVTMNCHHFERIFYLRIILHTICTSIFIVFSIVSVKLLKEQKRKSKSGSSANQLRLKYNDSSDSE